MVTSSEGGRRGWQGLRFESAFAALNLVRSALGRAPLGPDDNSAVRAVDLRDVDIRFRPQADGAVDDLVALRAEHRQVAYQLKSGLAQLPRAATTSSETAAALKQAGRELRDLNGAQLVTLVFGQLSSRTKVLARWLAGDDSVEVTPGSLTAIAQIMGLEASVDWATIRPRLRLVEAGSTTDLGAAIDLELASCYSGPADRLSVSDALRELVAVHSDPEGADLQPIDRERLAAWLKSRGLPAMSLAERTGDALPVLIRTCERYLQGVEQIRGGVPEIPRDALVEEIVERLAVEDVVLIGGGGSGKTELEAQVVRRHLSHGWMPVIIRREDLVLFGGDLARAAGAGGRTDLPNLVTQLLSQTAENLVVVVDGIDEIRRTSGSEQAALAAGLLGVLDGIRANHPDRTRLHLLLSCRRFDWSRMAGAGWSALFAPVESPRISADELAAVPETATEFRFLVGALQEPLRTIALSRPILLRMAYELWLQRHPEGAPQSGSVLSDITSEIGLWRTYYEECVCGVDVGLVASLSPGEVMSCHDDMARRHVEADHFALSVPAPPVEMNHPKAFPWLRSVEVAVVAGQTPGVLDTLFFHPSYTDFALALVAAMDSSARRHWAHSTALAVSLYPVWRRVPSLWTEAAGAAARLSDLLADKEVPFLTKRALLEGYFEASPDGTSLKLVAGTIADTGVARLLADFIELASIHTTPTPALAEAWLSELLKHVTVLDGARIDELLLATAKFIDSGAPTEGLRAVARELARVGFERAKQEGGSPVGLNNARILGRHSAALLSRALTPEVMGHLPIKVDDWADLGDLARATAVAADVRQVLADQEVLGRMHAVDVDATIGFLFQIIGGVAPVRDGKVDLGTPQQTSRLNMSMSLHDAWEGSWYPIAEAATALFERDRRYLQVSVFAWQIYGMATHGGNGSESFPHEEPGDHWLHDGSHSWWRAGLRTPTAHVRLADSGFEFVERRAASNDPEPFLYLCAIAEQIRWAGLVAILLDIAGRVLRARPPGDHDAIADAAATLIGRDRTLHLLEIRESAIAALPAIAAHTAGELREGLWAAVRQLADLDRIAKDEPAAPDEERERQAHAKYVAKYQTQLDAIPDDSSHSWERSSVQVQLDMLASFPPERAIAILRSGYERRLAWRAQAIRGDLPFDHPEVEECLAAVGEFFKQERADLLPDDLRKLHAQGVAVLGETKIPTNDAPVRYTSSMSEPRRLRPEDTDNPRARFCLEVQSLHSQHLNRRTSWEAEEAVRLLALIEDNRDKLGLDEPTPNTEPKGDFDEPEWHAQQPMPKRAWARLLLLYLEHLAEGEPSGLSTESIDRLLSLTSDLDPAKAEPASSSVPYTVRSETAAALFPLRAHGSNPEGFAERVTALLADAAPAVRRSIYFGARWLRGTDDAVYADILRTFAERETDPHLLESGTVLLLFPIPKDAETEVWGHACVSLLARLARRAAAPFGPDTTERTVDNVGAIAAHLFVRGESATTTALRKLMAEPIVPEASANLGWAVAKAAIDHIKEQYEPGRALEILGEYARRSAQSASMRPDVGASVIREELELASGIASVLGAALTGQQPMRRWTLTHEDFPSTPRADRMKPEVRRVERDVRRIWRDLVDPWLPSEWCLSMQRVLLHALRVAREVAPEEPGESEGMLQSWRLESRIASLEINVRDELVALIETLLPAARDRERLIRLLHELVETGHARSLDLMKRLAQEARAT